jgi:hypothetical protein
MVQVTSYMRRSLTKKLTGSIEKIVFYGPVTSTGLGLYTILKSGLAALYHVIVWESLFATTRPLGLAQVMIKSNL